MKTKKWKDDESSPIAQAINPWRPKADYRVLKTFKSEYNTYNISYGIKSK